MKYRMDRCYQKEPMYHIEEEVEVDALEGVIITELLIFKCKQDILYLWEVWECLRREVDVLVDIDHIKFVNNKHSFEEFMMDIS